MKTTWLFGKRSTIIIIGLILSPVFSHGADQGADGEALFNRFCSSCHGERASGQDPAFRQGGYRGDGSLMAPALDGSAHSWHHDPELLFDYVKSGSVDPESPMPAFGDRLDDKQIRAVISYFQSLWPERVRELYRYRFPDGLNPQPSD